VQLIVILETNMINLITTNNGTQKVITFQQGLALLHIPNMERRVRRDLDDALSIGYAHLNGFLGQPPVDECNIVFVLYNEPRRRESGDMIVECKILNAKDR
jgi:hypothetical protein